MTLNHPKIYTSKLRDIIEASETLLELNDDILSRGHATNVETMTIKTLKSFLDGAIYAVLNFEGEA